MFGAHFKKYLNNVNIKFHNILIECNILIERNLLSFAGEF